MKCELKLIVDEKVCKYEKERENMREKYVLKCDR